MKTPKIIVTINHPNCDITNVILATDTIFPAIMLHKPTGVIQITPLTIFMTTSKIVAHKSFTTCPLEPVVPKMLPNIIQKKTIPILLVPNLKI